MKLTFQIINWSRRACERRDDRNRNTSRINRSNPKRPLRSHLLIPPHLAIAVTHPNPPTSQMWSPAHFNPQITNLPNITRSSLYLLDITNLDQLVYWNIELLLLRPRIFPHPDKRVQRHSSRQYRFRSQPQLFLPKDINDLFLVRRVKGIPFS